MTRRSAAVLRRGGGDHGLLRGALHGVLLLHDLGSSEAGGTPGGFFLWVVARVGRVGGSLGLLQPPALSLIDTSWKAWVF